MKVLIAGGGTAGHINPGVAIAKYIKKEKPDAQILFVGTEKGLETKLVPKEGFSLELIRVRGFRRKISVDTFMAVKELFQGLLQSKRLIKKYKPDIVIGTGGYVCGPVIFSASRMKIPTLIHEQNAFPGVTNRLLSRFADVVAISFKESDKYFRSANNLKLTGNPIRLEMLQAQKRSAREKLGIKNEKPIVLIFGGSRGAENINEAVCEMISKYYKDTDWNIVYATGEKQYEYIMGKLGEGHKPSLQVLPYIYDMANAMTAADLAVCRSGAITLSELTALGIPSVLIPSPYVTANHQEHNARALEAQGAAVVILEKDLDGELIYEQINDLLTDKNQLTKMAKNAKKMGITDASEKIYSLIQDLIDKK